MHYFHKVRPSEANKKKNGSHMQTNTEVLSKMTNKKKPWNFKL